MIEPMEFFGAKCDNCQDYWIDEEQGFSAMCEVFIMENTLRDSEWHFGDGIEGEIGKHYCPNCYHFNEEDIFILKIINES